MSRRCCGKCRSLPFCRAGSNSLARVTGQKIAGLVEPAGAQIFVRRRLCVSARPPPRAPYAARATASTASRASMVSYDLGRAITASSGGRERRDGCDFDAERGASAWVGVRAPEVLGSRGDLPEPEPHPGPAPGPAQPRSRRRQSVEGPHIESENRARGTSGRAGAPGRPQDHYGGPRPSP